MFWKYSIKRLVFFACVLMVAPLIVLAWLEKRLSRSEAAFTMFGQLLALAPGLIGTYLRTAYYFGTLDACAWEVHLGFGSVLTHRHANLARNVSTGVYCVIGHATIEEGVRLASRISIPSGKRQHLDQSGQLSDGTRYDCVTVGTGTWVGEGAILMADVGRGCVVSAGAVVTTTVPDACIVGGNPARVLKRLESSAGDPAATD
jgi:acetyltransferase-like isoleucine patch superfamily enzyme